MAKSRDREAAGGGPGPYAAIRRRIVQLRAGEKGSTNTDCANPPHHQHLPIQKECGLVART